MLEYAYVTSLLVALAVLLVYLHFLIEKRERAQDAEWLAGQRENYRSRLNQKEQSPGEAFDVSAIAPQIQRLRQDYVAARRAKPHYFFYRRGLLAVTPEAVARLSFFDCSREKSKPAERDSVDL